MRLGNIPDQGDNSHKLKQPYCVYSSSSDSKFYGSNMVSLCYN